MKPHPDFSSQPLKIHQQADWLGLGKQYSVLVELNGVPEWAMFIVRPGQNVQDRAAEVAATFQDKTLKVRLYDR